MSRRSRRRERRNLKRTKTKKHYTLDDIAANAVLYKAFKLASKGVMFKESVQRYRLNVLFNNYDSKKKLLRGKDVRQGLISFTLCDRGKVRSIDSLHFRERVIQKAVCVEVLQPFFKTLIKENSASQKGKGTLFAQQMFERQLREFLRRHKTGYVLLIDFKKYFENIDHDRVYDFYDKNIKDEKLNKLCKSFVSIYEKGLGLGSEVSQFNAIMYLNQIDHLIKHHFKYYGRYMDDSYIIHHNKQELEAFYGKLRKRYVEYSIILNEDKTKIIPLTQPFSFLKTRYFLTNTNKVIKKPCRSSITRERRRLKRQLRLVGKGVLTYADIERSINSWAGSMKRRHARRSVFEILKLYKNIRNKKLYN